MIDDLDTLKTYLPEVFSSIPLPPGWDTDWRVVKVADPESSTPQGAEDELNQEVDPSLDPSPSPDWSVPRRPVFSSTEQFPGSPQAGSGGSIPPPPDAFAFYLPFHFFHPRWWGIYIVREPALQLADYVRRCTGGLLSLVECQIVVRVFLYGHEQFHHQAEAFATRLEISHRVPLFREGFWRFYTSTVDTDECVEEALASAHGYRRVDKLCFRDPNQPGRRAAALSALAEYIKVSPLGYRRALEFVPGAAFRSARAYLAELGHRSALERLGKRDPSVWFSFPHLYRGISQVNSRVNYLVYVGRPLATRERLQTL